MPQAGDPGYLINPNSAQVLRTKTHAPVANTIALATLPAEVGVRHQVTYVAAGWSRTSTATDPTLVISWTQAGVTPTLFTWYVGLAAGMQQIILPFPIVGDVNTAITATLAAGGADVLGTVFVQYGGS